MLHVDMQCVCVCVCVCVCACVRAYTLFSLSGVAARWSSKSSSVRTLTNSSPSAAETHRSCKFNTQGQKCGGLKYL